MRAEFWAARALSMDEGNVQATRLMAEINEAQDRPAALGWRIKVAQREPRSTGDIVAWAKSAFRFGQPEMAMNALQSLPPDFRNRSADCQELMAGCDLARHETLIAEAHFARAADLDRDNPIHRVNLAAFRLANSTSAEVRTAAARALEGVLGDSRASLFATRALLRDAILTRDRARTRQFEDKLRSLPERGFSDDLSCLDAAWSEADFQPALKAVEHRAESEAAWVTEAGEWLNSHAMAAETLHWFTRLPEPLQSNVRIQMTASEAHLALSDWNGLVTFLTERRWGDGEFLRRAMLIRCQRELSQPWEKSWQQLVTDVEGAPPDDLLLAQLILTWNWRGESLGLLWQSATKPGTGSKALECLWEFYSHTTETRELLRVASAQIELDPSNPTLKNNVAFLSLLLRGASSTSERLAREASSANPNVAEWAATYAYALHLAGKETEARKTMEKLSPEARARPGIGLYCAIVLAATGDDAQARECLKKLNRTGMLPEEQTLAANLARHLNIANR